MFYSPGYTVTNRDAVPLECGFHCLHETLIVFVTMLNTTLKVVDQNPLRICSWLQLFLIVLQQKNGFETLKYNSVAAQMTSGK
jgi:argininosuccinate lyase